MAQGYFCGDRQKVEETVVLYHRAPRRHLDHAPEFMSGAPMRLTSWLEKGLNWSSLDELTVLQTRIQSLVDKNMKLVNVIQVYNKAQ